MVVWSYERWQLECDTDLGPAACDMLGNRLAIVELQVVAHRNLAISGQNLVVTGYLRIRAVHRVCHKIAESSYASIVNLDYNEVRAGRPLITDRAKGHLARVDRVPLQAARLP